MADLPALWSGSPYADVEAHLQHLQAITPHSIMLYPYQVSFNSASHQANWVGVFLHLYRAHHTIMQFLTHPLGGRRHRAALFSTDTESWVGQRPPWHDRVYHAWCGIVAANPGRQGKRLLIWDPNGRYRLAIAPGTYLYNEVTLGAQRAFCTRAKARMRVDEVWYTGGEEENLDNSCLPMTVAWLARFMAEGVPEDLLGAGWVKLQG